MIKIFKDKHKSAALMITLLIITVAATFAFTASRIVISSIMRSTRLIDAMSANQAAIAGVEYSLLAFNSIGTPPSCGVGQKCEEDAPGWECSFDVENMAGCSVLSFKQDKSYASATIEKHFVVDNTTGLPAITTTGSISSTGQMAGTYRKLKVRIENNKVIFQ